MKKAFRAGMASALLFWAVAAWGEIPTLPLKSSNKILGVWVHPGQFGKEKIQASTNISTALAEYRRAGINTLLLLVKDTSGRVYYPSRLAAMDPAWTWDITGEIIGQATRMGMTIHAWFCVFPEGGLAGRVREHPEWLIRNPAGEFSPSLNPANREARSYAQSLILEFLDLYNAVTWVHLDYIRYPCDPQEPYFSYDAATRRDFQAVAGQDPAAVKARDSGNPLWNRWIEWNRDQVTIFVRELRTALAKRPSPAKLSAAVFPDATIANVLIGQDWAAWAAEGLVDMLCPMLYTDDHAYFSELARRAAAAGQGRCLVCPGIGLQTSHNKNTPEGMRTEISESLKSGADGVIFFSGGSLTSEFLDKLAETGGLSRFNPLARFHGR